jgi:mannose-6-phosphate isomerase
VSNRARRREDATGRVASETRRVDKPWGYELIYAVTDRYCGKLLFVRAGEALSLQYHRLKDETLYLHDGLAEIEIGELDGSSVTTIAHPGNAFRVVPGTVHRLRALRDSLFLEVSTPELDDVVRLDDRYGRAHELGAETNAPSNDGHHSVSGRRRSPRR